MRNSAKRSITTLALVMIAGLVVGLFQSPRAGALVEEASSPATFDEYPASVAYRSKAGASPKCSGSLVHPSWVLTASHCIDSTGVLNKEFVIGATDLNASTAEVRKVATNPDGTAIVVRHPENVGDLGFRDIALVRLSQPSTKAPVSLADPARAEERAIWAMGKTISVFGYGMTCDEGCSSSKILRTGTAEVTQVPDDNASKSVAIAPESGEFICGGDSGAPYVARTGDGSWRQFGISSQINQGEKGTHCGAAAWGAAVGTTTLYNWVQSVIAPQTQFKGIVSGDFDNDGIADIIGAQANGSVSLFRGTGSPGTAQVASAAAPLGSHWMRYDHVLSGDFDRDGKTDLIGRRHNGQLLFHRGTGSPGTARLASGVEFNAGWQVFDSLLAGDFDRDGHDDIVARKPAGTLHFYRGVGTPGTAKVQGGAQFNAGWQVFDTLLAGDFDRDGHDDIVARKPAGTLHFYRGVGTPGTAKVQGGAQFNAGWQVFDTLLAGDFDRDGHDDIVARKPAGTLHFYRGVGTPGTAKVQGGAQFNAGWQIFA